MDLYIKPAVLINMYILWFNTLVLAFMLVIWARVYVYPLIQYTGVSIYVSYMG